MCIHEYNGGNHSGRLLCQSDLKREVNLQMRNWTCHFLSTLHMLQGLHASNHALLYL